MISLGNVDIKKVSLGIGEVKKASVGTVVVFSSGMFDLNILYNLKDAKWWTTTGKQGYPWKTINLEVPSGATKFYHKQASYTSGNAKLLTRRFYNSSNVLLAARAWTTAPYHEETYTFPAGTAYVVIEYEDYTDTALSVFWNVDIRFS